MVIEKKIKKEKQKIFVRKKYLAPKTYKNMICDNDATKPCCKIFINLVFHWGEILKSAIFPFYETNGIQWAGKPFIY